LQNASLKVNRGDFIAVLGRSGIGKSTILKLLLGVYNVKEGQVYLDNGNEKKPLDVYSRTIFSYVPQGNLLFSGTLKDNVAFIKADATDIEIENALKTSCAYDFVNQLPDGLNTVVGENGAGLSEGQIQRIAIARALLCGAPVILLDEATSALDDITEKQLLSNLKGLKDVTVIIVSHRKQVLDVCNRAVAVKNKRIEEIAV
jgi:ATP-binding cassette subfamily B protein